WTDGAPIFIGRDTTPNGEGVTINFRSGSQGTALFSGDGSAEIFIETTATGYQDGGFRVMYSGFPDATGGGGIFVPTAVPEPGEGLWVVMGVLLLGSRALKGCVRSGCA
ncbi:MAG TPA: hypothetical protein VHI52_13750, partial [Verrucomicrobiae bacterium]|nr:hypothetical protein [Verrucomicrobiae bacterium]